MGLWDVKESTHCSKRVGDVVPDVVVYLSSDGQMLGDISSIIVSKMQG